MDKVADSVGKDAEKPKMYYSERTQQNNFECDSCGSRTDILGRYGYCCNCGMHNGRDELNRQVERLRQRIESGGDYVACVKDLVSEFDSYARQIAGQLVRRVPMTPSRRSEWQRKLFHSLAPRAEELRTIFDIDILKSLSKEECDFAARMFMRRHVYVRDTAHRERRDRSIVNTPIAHRERSVATRGSLLSARASPPFAVRVLLA